MSDPGRHADLFDGLPRDAGALAKIVQGLLIHQHIAPAYGVTLSNDQQAQSHVRAVEGILDNIATRDDRPLSAARATHERQVGVCRHFTLLHVAMLRTHGIPARARCGFGAYFEKGKYLDHWVTEYWNERRKCWLLFDAQIDDRQRELFRIEFDTADVSRDQFLVAGDAWQLCRGGKADPSTFGILDMYGLWFIAGNLARDVAALNKCCRGTFGAQCVNKTASWISPSSIGLQLSAASPMLTSTNSVRFIGMSGYACQKPCSTPCSGAHRSCNTPSRRSIRSRLLNFSRGS